MNSLSGVVWKEGMYLGPHHFQAQSRYFEDTARFAMEGLWFEPYGVIAAEIDAEALLNGTLSLVHAHGVFPDGLTFNMPDADPLPEPRNIAGAFPPARESVTVSLAVSPRKQNGANCEFPENGNGQSARYRAREFLLYDETTGGDEKPVMLGVKTIRLLLDTEDGGDALRLPVARVMRDGSGNFFLDETFVPPCLRISASARLMSLLERLIGILEEKSAAFSLKETAEKRSWAEFSTREIANFWLLHTVNSSLAPLRHAFYSKRGHPEELFREMLRLGGALCTFALDSHPRDLPLYNHARLDVSFTELDRHIREHLETVVPSQFLTIPLIKRADYFYEGEVADGRCFGRARWIFAIRSPVGEVELIAKTPQLVKLCSKSFVPQLVKRALPGLALVHLPVAPSSVPSKVDFQYFSVSKSGPCWDHMVQTRVIGLYVPGELPNPEIELMAVLES